MIIKRNRKGETWDTELIYEANFNDINKLN